MGGKEREERRGKGDETMKRGGKYKNKNQPHARVRSTPTNAVNDGNPLALGALDIGKLLVAPWEPRQGEILALEPAIVKRAQTGLTAWQTSQPHLFDLFLGLTKHVLSLIVLHLSLEESCLGSFES